MAYVEGVVYDADSHLMELPGWLEEYADPDIRDRIRPLALGGAGALAAKAIADAQARAGDPDKAAALEDRLLTAKGWGALGAFDPSERSRALDLLGFGSQLVFSTFAPTQFLDQDRDLLRGGLRAHNRAVAAFCADDQRLAGVGMAVWTDPADVLDTVEEALALGNQAILFPSHPGRGISPTHPDYDRVWATLADRDVPFMLHIGGAGRTTKPAFHDNGRPVTDFLGGGENVRAKDSIGLSHVPEQFLASMILDGVFDTFPTLRGGCIEQGALWVPGWLRKLDFTQDAFSRNEPTVAGLELRASEYAHRNLWFTPFPREDVGWLIDQCGDDLFLFSSDYPHPEGSKDPVGNFEATLSGVSTAARERFYRGNYAEMMGLAA